MSSWATACFQSAYGVQSVGNADGCGTGYTLAGEFQRLIDSFSLTLVAARDRASQGRDPGFGGGTSFPWQIEETLRNTAGYYCTTYPGACPPDPTAMTNQYVQILHDVVAQYGFDMQGNYNAALDNQPGVDSLYPEGITETPTADPTGNVSYYSNSSGWAPPMDALPPTVSPTIPAFTSPVNTAATSPGAPLASGGGSTVASTASGSGSSQGGSTTQQSTLVPSVLAGPAISALSPDAQQKRLLIILLIIAALVFFFGRG